MLFLMLAVAAAPATATLPGHACPANTTNRQSISPRIIVQGGIQPNTNPGGMIAIGPKQDDPAQPKPGAGSGTSLIAIGPKQDDPVARSPASATGGYSPAIGPKQDDPVQPGRGIAASMKTDCGLAPAPRPH